MKELFDMLLTVRLSRLDLTPGDYTATILLDRGITLTVKAPTAAGLAETIGKVKSLTETEE